MPVLLCFHGYGESAASFCFLEKYIGDKFMIIAIDLPFHGKTEWNEGLTFTPIDLLEIIRQIVPASSTSSQMVVAGFSMGGRIALSLLEYIPHQIKKILLLAPDGLKMNGWYWLATQQKQGNQLFRAVMKKADLFLEILRTAHKMRLVNPGIYKFTDQYIRNEKAREDLYKRWTTMRKFKPNRQKIKTIIVENKIPVKLLYGEHDRIIRFETGEEFKNEIDPYGELYIIPSGHQVLQEKNIDLIVGLLKD